MQKLKFITISLVLVLSLMINGCSKEVDLNNSSNSEPEIKYEIIYVDKDTYITFRIINTTTKPFKLTYNNGQEYEFKLMDENENVVWVYSQGKEFTESIMEKILKPKETITYEINLEEIAEEFVGNYKYIVFSTANELITLNPLKGELNTEFIERESLKKEALEKFTVPFEEVKDTNITQELTNLLNGESEFISKNIGEYTYIVVKPKDNGAIISNIYMLEDRAFVYYSDSTNNEHAFVKVPKTDKELFFKKE